MEIFPDLTQQPPPGESRVMYCGDSVRFTLTLSKGIQGKAWVRTNLGSAAVSRKEIINRVEKSEIKLDEAWYDIEMERENDRFYSILLPLHQTGFFQAKCFFAPLAASTPVWPAGDNCIFNVEPAGTCCANIIYNAFVRQFGKSKSAASETSGEKKLSSIIQHLDEKGYTVIPESGKFRDLKKQIKFIFSTLGCRILHLLPIHPTPTTYARMGRFGSPYAALNFTQVDPALAEFDPSATPLEQFMELCDHVHFYNGYLFMDIAINHTGWAAAIHETHPEWLIRAEDGEIKAPGAWGIVWADLTKLDYSNIELWEYMADVFLLWCQRGVDGFRCDAGYMIPVDAWEYIVAKVRQQYPKTLFFLEGLGGPVRTTCKILSRANFNFAYSELFQNYTRQEISDYLPKAFDISNTFGHTIHFAETHDNNRLASVSIKYAKMRTGLCALFSICGGFGFANGVEWFATEKIDVHESSCLNWGSRINQVEYISRLTRILKYHPGFWGGVRLELIQQNQCECLVLQRHNMELEKILLILVNLDCEKSNTVRWQETPADCNTPVLTDLISKTRFQIHLKDGVSQMELAPGAVLALTPDPDDLSLIDKKKQLFIQVPERVYLQKLKAEVMAIHTVFNGYGNLEGIDIDKQAMLFADNPLEFIRSFNKASKQSRVIELDCSRNLKRRLMIPPGFFLLIKCNSGFRASIMEEKKSNKNFSKISTGYEEGIPGPDKKQFFALFFPKKIKNHHKKLSLILRIFEPGKTRVQKISLLYLAPFDTLYMQSTFTRKEIVKTPFLKLLDTNNRGSMLRAAAWWGRLDSRYDALLGANMARTQPENRWMVFSRCRIWAIFQGYSRELAPDCLETFTFSYDHGGKWLFHVPTSEGRYYALELCLFIDPGKNNICLALSRCRQNDKALFLEDDKGVNLIFRPDIEDRSFHDIVKAFKGPETKWPDAVYAFNNGFYFSLSNGKKLKTIISRGEFILEPEWHYMIHRPLEEQRGLDADSDLYSPGYFHALCLGGEKVLLNADIIEDPGRELDNKKQFDAQIKALENKKFKKELPLASAVYKSLDAFLVDRGKDKSVIAGYPWFLDWGRDSLIFCRSLIELGRLSDARAILRLFGRFEDKGTLPNMICGEDTGNIETSDAPLWFFACCKDLVEKDQTSDFLEEKLDGRCVKDILLSMAESLINGAKTGVIADPETLLLYSPSHFTWMDTNFPAGSPRQGYPVEIQALWYNALVFMGFVDPSHKKQWQVKAQKVQKSVSDLFYNKDQNFFSDCLHLDSFKSAQTAVPDDHLRPNQLLLVTMNVIKDKKKAQKCVETCQELLVPGGIRSLADRRVETPIHILYNGQLLNDPHKPYSGSYKGDEDTGRKPAYHNGTAWTWQFPVFCEAWSMVFGKDSYSTSLAWLGSVISLMRKGAAGYIPEILDGDFPHTQRGCDAQAWGSSEFARVIHKLIS